MTIKIIVANLVSLVKSRIYPICHISLSISHSMEEKQGVIVSLRTLLRLAYLGAIVHLFLPHAAT